VDQLSRGLGKTELRILEYLNEKARRSRVDEKRTIACYANTSELAESIGISSACVCQAVNALIRAGRIAIYPNGRKRNRYFGSLILPRVDQQEVSVKVQNILSTNNRKLVSNYLYLK
jgi:DNA-binding MarR family transcriptional regulator